MFLRILMSYFLVGLTVSLAASIQDATTSASFSQPKVDAAAVLATSTSGTCVADQAATSIYAGTPKSVGCSFPVTKPGSLYGTNTTTYNGQGYTGPKFGVNGAGALTTNLNTITGIALYSPSPAHSSTIAATSNAAVQPFITNNANLVGYGAQFSISGDITFVDYTFSCFCTVYAAAQALDPEIFNFNSPGTHSLNFSYGLGVNPANSGSSAIPQLSFYSNDPNGVNEIDMAASFSGVSYKGQSLNGNLFSLTIGADGVINSPNDLKVNFTPWQGLGLTGIQVASIDKAIQDEFAVNADGSVSFAPGSSLDLFGDDPGALLPSINFDNPTGIVTYDDSSVVLSTDLPEPGSLALTLIALLFAPALRRRLMKYQR